MSRTMFFRCYCGHLLQLPSLIELERPQAFNPSSTFPPHTFRFVGSFPFTYSKTESCESPGDIARVEKYSPSAVSSKSKKPTKSTSESRKSNTGNGSFEGVVYKVGKFLWLITSEVNFEQVTDGKIVIAVDPSQTEGGDVEFPDRCVL